MSSEQHVISGIIVGFVYPRFPLINLEQKPFSFRYSPMPDDHKFAQVGWQVNDSVVKIYGEYESPILIDQLRFDLKQPFIHELDLINFQRSENRIFCDEWVIIPETGEKRFVTADFFPVKIPEEVSELSINDLERELPLDFQVYFQRFLRCMRLAKFEQGHDTPIYLHRAVEALRHYFMDKDGISNRKSWLVLQSICGFTKEDYEERLQQFANKPRHGGNLTKDGDYLASYNRIAMIQLATEIGSAVIQSLMITRHD